MQTYVCAYHEYLKSHDGLHSAKCSEVLYCIFACAVTYCTFILQTKHCVRIGTAGDGNASVKFQ